MKILMTGATSLQVKPATERRSAVVKIDVPGGVVESLTALGHDVDWRLCWPGEDLSGYDLLWINVAGVNSVNSTPGAPGMLWAMAQEQIPAVVFLDDWKTRLTYQQAKNFGKGDEENIYFDRHLLSNIRKWDPDANPTHYTHASAVTEYNRVMKLLRERGLSDDELAKVPEPLPFYSQRLKYTDEEWARVKPTVIEGARIMMRGRRNSIIGIPAYRWGSTDVVRPTLPPGVAAQEIIRLDPSYIAVDIATRAPRATTASYKWGLAALGDHTEWLAKQGLPYKWEIECIGHSSNRKVKTELDVVEFYSSCAGILSPSYYHAGSGWWRSRFIYAAALQMPIYAADGEAAPLGDAYSFTPQDIENFSGFVRTDIGRHQFQTLWPLLSTRDEFTDTVRNIVHRAVEVSNG
jgi:hypothetical protein